MLEMLKSSGIKVGRFKVDDQVQMMLTSRERLTICSVVKPHRGLEIITMHNIPFNAIDYNFLASRFRLLVKF